MSRPNLSDPVPVRLPEDVLRDIEAVAETCERTRSWVIVRALKLYLKGEGAEVLAVRNGRDQAASGDVHDMDAVLRELEAPFVGLSKA